MPGSAHPFLKVSKMAGTTLTERVGLGEVFIEHLDENARELGAQGLNVPYWKAAVRSSIDAVKAANERQEALKAELKAATVSLNAADHEAYVLVSGGIDAAVGAYGKDSEKGRVAARMRSKLHRPEGEAEVPSVAVPPA